MSILRIDFDLDLVIFPVGVGTACHQQIAAAAYDWAL